MKAVVAIIVAAALLTACASVPPRPETAPCIVPTPEDRYDVSRDFALTCVDCLDTGLPACKADHQACLVAHRQCLQAGGWPWPVVVATGLGLAVGAGAGYWLGAQERGE